MVAVDNYTAPFERLTTDRRVVVERVTYSCVIKRLIELMECELLRCSYFVGRDLPTDEPLPWSTYDQFREMTEDLTESASADAAFGLCSSEIRALWRVAFPRIDGMPDPLELVDPSSAEADNRRYSIRDVLGVLDDLRTCGSDAERIAFQPKARAAFITLRPHYTFQPSGSYTPILLARVDSDLIDRASFYEPSQRVFEEPGPKSLARQYVMPTARDETIHRSHLDPIDDIASAILSVPNRSGHLPAVHDGTGEPSNKSPELQSIDLGAGFDVKVYSHVQPENSDVYREVNIEPHQLSRNDSGSDRVSIIGSDHREGSNASTAPTSVPSSLNTSPRSSHSTKRSYSDEDENERARDTAEDVGPYHSESDRSSSGRSVRRRLRSDSAPGSP